MLKMRKEVSYRFEIDGEHAEVFERILEAALDDAEETIRIADTTENWALRQAMQNRDMVIAIRNSRTLDRTAV